MTSSWSSDRRLERWTTAAFFFTATVLMVVSWTGLMVVFDYPGILREPPASVLSKLLEAGPGLRWLWVGMTVSSLMLLPCVVLLSRVFAADSAWLKVGTVIGVAAALVQAVGLIRWVFVVPVLAETWGGTSDPGIRAAVEVAFVVVNQYGGVALGETLGFVLTGLWMVSIGLVILQTRTFPPAAGWIAIGVGIGVSAGVLEWAGQSWAVEVNAWSYQGLLVLFLYFAFRLWRGPGKDH